MREGKRYQWYDESEDTDIAEDSEISPEMENSDLSPTLLDSEMMAIEINRQKVKQKDKGQGVE